MRIEPLYRMRFRYPESFGAGVEGPHGSEGHYYFIAEGTVEGELTGTMRGSNRPRSRVDGNALPDVDGAIVTDDGATILFHMRGFAHPYPEGRRQIVVSGHHTTSHERYRWMNDVLCVGTGEIRPRTGGGPRQVVGHDVDFVIDVATLVWEPIAE